MYTRLNGVISQKTVFYIDTAVSTTDKERTLIFVRVKNSLSLVKLLIIILKGYIILSKEIYL